MQDKQGKHAAWHTPGSDVDHCVPWELIITGQPCLCSGREVCSMVRKQVQKRLSVVFCKWGSSIFFIYFFFFPLREAGTKLRGAGAGVMARGGVGRGEQRGISPRHLMFILALLLCSPLWVTSICQLQPSITALSPSSSYSLSS